MNTVRVTERNVSTDGVSYKETVYGPEETRVKVSFKVGAAGQFQPDVTSEAETVETAMANLNKAQEQLEQFRIKNGYKIAE